LDPVPVIDFTAQKRRRSSKAWRTRHKNPWVVFAARSWLTTKPPKWAIPGSIAWLP